LKQRLARVLRPFVTAELIQKFLLDSESKVTRDYVTLYARNKKRLAVSREAFCVFRIASSADARQFFVVLDVHDLELFGVHSDAVAEKQFAKAVFVT